MPNLLLTEEQSWFISAEKLRTLRGYRCEPGMLLSVVNGLSEYEAVYVAERYSLRFQIWSQAKVTKVNKPGLLLYA